MNIKAIKMHNIIIEDAVREINTCYQNTHTTNKYYGQRISAYALNKDFGLIKSIKGIFAPKKYFIKEDKDMNNDDDDNETEEIEKTAENYKIPKKKKENKKSKLIDERDID